MRSLSLRRRAQLRHLGAIPFSRRLGLLATWYGTDKGPRGHGYTTHYQRHLQRRRREALTILEIGVGGQETLSGGPSLRMWRSYFRKSQIVGVDIYEKRLPAERRITIVRGDQSDRLFLEKLATIHGAFDLIIDDGSHRGDHINITFETLWPHLNEGGLYVIEDLQTAYEVEYGGGPRGTAKNTSMSLLANLLDDVQLRSANRCAAVYVYPNIAFVEKAQ